MRALVTLVVLSLQILSGLENKILVINVNKELGGLAQLGERQLCKLDVIGSIPISSTLPYFYLTNTP